MAGHLCDTTWQQTKHLHQVVWWTFAWIYWGRFQVSNQIFLIVMVIPSTRKENYCLWEPHDLNLLPASHPHFIHYDVQFRHFMVRKEEGETWNSRAFCVAGVALGDIDRHFAWQAYGTGLALMARWPRLAPWSPRLFAWQAWRLATSTIVSDGLEAVGILSSSVKCIIILDIYFTHTHMYIYRNINGWAVAIEGMPRNSPAFICDNVWFGHHVGTTCNHDICHHQAVQTMVGRVLPWIYAAWSVNDLRKRHDWAAFSVRMQNIEQGCYHVKL